VCRSSTCKYKRPPEPGDDDTTPDFYGYLSKFSSEEQTDRLKQLLIYLRTRHSYCYYCGALYDDVEQLEKMCPGLTEEEH